MPISNTTPINTYTGNASTTVYPYSFYIQSSNDIKVYLDSVEQGSGYTVSGVGNSSGGNVTFDTAPDTDVVIRLERVTSLDRTTDYENGGGLESDVLDADVDRVVAMVQELDRRTLQENSSGVWDADSAKITNVATPTADGDAVNKSYADAAYGSIDSTFNFISAQASDPATRDNGDALQKGDRYYNTTTDMDMVYNGSAFVSALVDAGIVSTADATAITIDASENTTLAGNLTVEGTGGLVTDYGASIGGNTDCWGTVNMNSNQINGVADPTAAQDAVTKNYVDTCYEAHARVTTDTALSTSTNTTIPFGFADINNGSYYDTTTYHYDEPVAGYYHISYTLFVEFSANATVTALHSYLRNGAGQIKAVGLPNSSMSVEGGQVFPISTSAIVYLTGSTSVYADVYLGALSAGTATILGTGVGSCSSFSAHLISRE